MANILHILNGDSTLAIFNRSGIEGDTLVWHEVLCEGPVQFDITTDSFWEVRSEFMCNYFETTQQGFDEKVIQPFRKLESLIDNYEEIILWFEYDLFCQVNMIALISWLNQIEYGQVSLICVGRFEGQKKLLGLGEIQASEYPKLLQKRVKLNTREFTHAQDAWESYCSTYADDIYNFILLKMEEFQYLPDAFDTHLKRFPSSATGLNEIEQKILDLYLGGFKEDHKIVGEMLRWQQFLGFGDLQYFNVVSYLRPLLKLVDQSAEIPGKEDVELLLDRDYALGGASASNWVWDENEKALIPIESMP